MSSAAPSTELTTLTEGDYALKIACPECKRDVLAPISLGAVLTITTEGGKLRATISTKRIDHSCTGEQVVPLFGPGADNPDVD
jgi:hypothetical protein